LPLLSDPSQATQLATAQEAAREEDIDGEALSTFAENDIHDVLQVTKFGPKRKLWARLQAGHVANHVVYWPLATSSTT
jgi:hypothetical protein